MEGITDLSLQLHLSKNQANERLRERYSESFTWHSSQRKLIAELGPVDGFVKTRFTVPKELKNARPSVVFNFREQLSDTRDKVCCGANGKPLRPYFHGTLSDGDGAKFAVPNTIVVIRGILQDNRVYKYISYYRAEIREQVVTATDIRFLGDGAFELPPYLDRFKLPVSLVERHLVDGEIYQPLYYDETDEFFSCFGKAVDVRCPRCQIDHSLPLEKLLRDRKARLLLLRNYGYIGEDKLSKVRVGFLPEHLCPKFSKSHQSR